MKPFTLIQVLVLTLLAVIGAQASGTKDAACETNAPQATCAL